MDIIQYKKISEINLGDKFFCSLREDYPGFDGWFNKKAKKGESAFLLDDNGISGFLYLKEENEEDNTINPKLEKKHRLKVGTFKIDAHGTKLGERFVKIIIDKLFEESFDEAYVTIFEKHNGLIELLLKYGFEYWGTKESEAGIENVYVKSANKIYNDILLDFPKMNVKNNKKFLLAIYPEYHTRMFPNSQLKTERTHVIEDTAFTNSIEKIYLSGAPDLLKYNANDILVIYRTAERGKSARYTAVATSVCVVEEIKVIDEFNNYNEFYNYCKKHSVFNDNELSGFWRTKKYPYIIKMLYNIALNKRIIRDRLLNDVGLDENIRWTLVPLNDIQFNRILELGEVDESFIID